MKNVSEKPILFNGEMVKAILNGRKTQTRRVIKIPKWGEPEHEIELCHDYPVITCKDTGCQGQIFCPYDADELWVRESCVISSYLKDTGPWATFKDGCQKTESGKYSETSISPKEKWWKAPGYRLTPSIHMPRWASRIQLKVKNIRVERLTDISEDDAKLEGIESSHDGTHIWFKNYLPVGPANFKYVSGSIKSFESLWNSINEKRGFGWDLNPWVWIIEFELKEIKGQ